MDLRLEYQAQQYWFDAADRAQSFIDRAVAHATARHARGLGPQLTEADIRTQLAEGKKVCIGTDWDSYIRSRTALDAQRAATQPAPAVPRQRCDCGHTIPAGSVMHASLGTACPDCYDRLSD